MHGTLPKQIEKYMFPSFGVLPHVRGLHAPMQKGLHAIFVSPSTIGTLTPLLVVAITLNSKVTLGREVLGSFEVA